MEILPLEAILTHANRLDEGILWLCKRLKTT